MATAKEITDSMIKETVDKFIALLEEAKGKGKWEKPFFGNLGIHRNMFTKRMYEGFNVLLLDFVAQQKGYTSNLWLTAKQAKDHKTYIRKEEFHKATKIIFWKFMEKTEKGKPVYETDKDGNVKLDKDGNPIRVHYVFTMYHEVYNECQLQNYKPKEPEKVDENILHKINEFKDNYLDRIGASYTEGHGRACFIPSLDVIELPSISQFNRDMLLEYIPVAAHETVHWSGAKSRLNRDLSGHFGDDKYAYEELIADIGAGFISQEFNQPYLFSNNNLKYIESWIKELKDKPNTLVSACSKAKVAYEYLMKLASED